MMNPVASRGVRKSILAGSWYPGSASELGRTVDGLLAGVPDVALPGDLVGLIAPHAGYMYSGPVAAHAYKILQGLSFDVVAVVSPIHRMYAGSVVVNDASHYETPLGLVEVDSRLVAALEERVDLNRVEWDDEHSLEIQLPFLQRVLDGFRLLPIMQGDQSLSTSQKLADALVDILQGGKALLVASTDLSHFHSYTAAVQLDKVVLDLVSRYDPLGLSRALKGGEAEACGGGPVITVMLAARALGADRAQILHYANSGDVTGDRSRVVGYLAAALFRTAAQ